MTDAVVAANHPTAFIEGRGIFCDQTLARRGS